MIGLLALLAASLSAAPQGPAAPAPAASRPAAAVAIPFDPPLGQTLRYRMTRTVAKQSGTVEVRVDYEIGFSRHGEGFQMDVRTVNFTYAPMAPEVMDRIRPLLLETLPPFSVRLDAQGRLLLLNDAAGYLERMFATFERQARELGVADHSLFRLLSGLARDMTAEQSLNALTMYIAPALEFAAMRLVVGEALASEVDAPALIGPGTFRQHMTILPQRIEGDLLHIRVNNMVPPEESRRALLGAIDAVPVTGEGRNTAELRARTRAQVSAMELTRSSEEDYAVETGTGLTRRYRSVEHTVVRSAQTVATQTDTRVLERIE